MKLVEVDEKTTSLKPVSPLADRPYRHPIYERFWWTAQDVGLPLLLLYVGTIASAKNGSAVWHETRALIPGLGIGLMWAVLFAAIGLVLASFTGRRAYSTGIVAISCVLTFFLALLLIQAEGGQSATSSGARIAGLFSPFTILDGVRVWLGGDAQTGLGRHDQAQRVAR